MAQSHFERIMDKELAATAAAMLAIPLGESHLLALLQGRHQAFVRAKAAYKEAARSDEDQDF